MKIQQIEYVLEIYRTGSISQAAKNMFLSQPNLSRSIKSLEDELGFELFSRSSAGVVFTTQGLHFVEYARTIMRQLDAIQSISTSTHRSRFSLLGFNFTPLNYAFCRLCAELRDSEYISVSMGNVSTNVAIEAVANSSCDLALITTGKSALISLEPLLESRRISYIHLRELPCNVNLAPDHPLLTSGKPFDFQDLYDYPMVDYLSSPSSPMPLRPPKALPFINPEKIFWVDTSSIRSEIVMTSNAYSIGGALPPKRIEQLGWVSIPLPNIYLNLGYIILDDIPLSPIAKHFLQLLDEELAYLDKPKEN